jgi:hypothetical protein
MDDPMHLIKPSSTEAHMVRFPGTGHHRSGNRPRDDPMPLARRGSPETGHRNAAAAPPDIGLRCSDAGV